MYLGSGQACSVCQGEMYLCRLFDSVASFRQGSEADKRAEVGQLISQHDMAYNLTHELAVAP